MIDDSDKMILSFSPSVGLNEFADNNLQLHVNPNPSSGEFKIDFATQKKSDIVVKLMNSLGELIFTEKAKGASEYNKSFNLQYLPKGIYFVKVEMGAVSKTRKLVLQ